MKKIFIIIAFFSFAFFLFGTSQVHATTCSWTRFDSGDCLPPRVVQGGGDIWYTGDAISNQGAMAVCQHQQDDSHYGSDCSTGDKYIIKKYTGPWGERCEEKNDFCTPQHNNYNRCWDKNGVQTWNDTSTNTTNWGPAPGQNPSWDISQCGRCSGFTNQNITWNFDAKTVTVNTIKANNWHPRLKLDPPNTGDNTIIDRSSADTYVDFKVDIFEEGNPTAIATKTFAYSNPSDYGTYVSCTYNTNDSFSTRDPLSHYMTCEVKNFTFTNVNFQSGKNYSLKTQVKISSFDDTKWNTLLETGATTACTSQASAPIVSPSPTPILSCADLTTSAQPLLGTAFAMTCQKSASYLGATTYDFRLIQKDNPQSTDPNPLPTPFSQNGTDPVANYSLPANGYGYYLFQCRVCAQGGGFCTDWQSPTGSTTTDCGPNATFNGTTCGCNVGFGNCDGNWSNGCEVNLFNGGAFCSACGITCSTGQTCQNGQCVGAPPTATPALP